MVKESLQTAQKNKRERDKDLEAGVQKIDKLKARTSEIKTNKEYQALLKEIEAAEQEEQGDRRRHPSLDGEGRWRRRANNNG